MNERVLAEAAALYGVPPDRLTPLSGGHFAAVYEVVLQGTPCVVRIIPPSDEIDGNGLHAINAWTTYLAAHGAPVPQPISTLEGDLVSQVIDEGQRYAITATTKARGFLAETLGQAQWTDLYFHNIGVLAGKIHALAEQYVPDPTLRRPAWDEIGDLFSVDQPADPSVKAKKREIIDRIRGLPAGTGTYGMIHGDFHFGNFFVDMDNDYAITLFDFDDCAYGWYVFDTALLLFDVLVLYEGADREQFATRFLKAYLSGYQTQRHLDAFWLEKVPYFLKLLEISYYAMLAPHYRPGEGLDDFWVARFMPGRQERVMEEVPYVSLNFANFAQ